MADVKKPTDVIAEGGEPKGCCSGPVIPIRESAEVFEEGGEAKGCCSGPVIPIRA